jgi:hypothetical protein
MSDYVLFQMSEWTRRPLIQSHKFYVEQARKRLLAQFENIEEEAAQASEDWLTRSNDRFDPDNHDPADFYEAAHSAGIEFYELLNEMRNQTWLGVVAGMFHEWDKQLRTWLVREIERWHPGTAVPLKIWSANFNEIGMFLQGLGWDVLKMDFFKTLDVCRCVVNVYKHGDGKSFEELKEKYPEYLNDPLGEQSSVIFGRDYRDHTHLRVSEEQFVAFSESVLSFWAALPEHIWESEVEIPSCFEKEFLKDRKAYQ